MSVSEKSFKNATKPGIVPSKPTLLLSIIKNAFDVDWNQQEECGSTLTVDYNQHRMNNHQYLSDFND